MAKKRAPIADELKAKVSDRIEWQSFDPQDKGIKRGTVIKTEGYDNSVVVQLDKRSAKKVERTVVAHHRYKIIKVGKGPAPVKTVKQNVFNPSKKESGL